MLLVSGRPLISHISNVDPQSVTQYDTERRRGGGEGLTDCDVTSKMQTIRYILFVNGIIQFIFKNMHFHLNNIMYIFPFSLNRNSVK